MHDLSGAMLEAIMASASDAIFSHDCAGRITRWGKGAERLFGYAPDEMIGQPLLRLIPEAQRADEAGNMDRLRRGMATPAFDTRRIARKGSSVETTVSITPILGPDGQVLGGLRIVRDIGAVNQQRRELERLNQLYSALRAINQTIARSLSPQQLFDEVSRILVQEGGFRTALIGIHDPGTRQIVPMACDGNATEILRESKIYSDDRIEGQGPGGRAFRSGKPVICNDTETDPSTQHLRQMVARLGLLSWAVFPIFCLGETVGLLIVYSDRKDYFQEPEISLLRDAAADVSFGLDLLAREQARNRAEALVRSEQAFGEAMINTLPGIVYFYDMSGRFIRWNRNFETVSEYSSAEIATMHPLDFFPEEERPLLATRINEVFSSGEAAVEAHFKSKSGLLIPHYFTGRRVEMGGHDYLIGVGIDITDRVRAEEASRLSEQRYRALFEHAPDGILIGTAEGFIDANQSMCRMLGLRRDEIIGRRASDFVAEDERSRLTAAFREFAERPRYHHQWMLRRADNSVFPADVIAEQLPDGNVMAMARDVSEREAAADTLRDLNRTLEQRVETRTRDLAEALSRAERADKVKSAFLANMSHELRTPLNSIIGFTGIILQGLAGPLNDEQRKQLGMVRNSARHLLDLINDVLDISKIEAGQLSVRHEAFDIAASIDHAIEQIRPMAERKGLSLTIDAAKAPAILVADRRRVEQILLNLLSNAVKFTTEGAVILKVATSPDFRGKDGLGPPRPAVRFDVTDTGIGIGLADLETLFQPFRQLDSGLTRQHEGTGLGLAICRRLARLMDGEVSAISAPGKGSTFTAIIPLEQAP
ncbi:PAS domain S-box protein [Szabonella alba]|uniref:histidine kinase n=1 Tax=Szabonella alba TaxID=2804194 RepID=A0A8K0VDV1_9RHOB|nr:PAS domain S-box protein [Szabonella alba]MBL4919296.1 PAS domain S-box protein [Szabonella alba]